MKLLLGMVAWPLHWAREGQGDMAFVRFLLVMYGPSLVGAILSLFNMWQTTAIGYLWMCVVGFLLIWETPSRPGPAAAPA